MNKNSLKFWLNLLIYIAIAFVVWMLIKFDYLSFRNINFNLIYLIISFISLFSGYLLLPLAWQSILNKHHIKLSFSESLISEGKPVFAKYLPGKFMVLIGRAGFVSLKGYPLTQTSVISFKAQIISLIVNLFLGVFVIFLIPLSTTEIIIWFTFLLVLILILFVKPVYNFIVSKALKIFKSNSTVDYISPSESLLPAFWYLLAYFLWGLGFSLLCFSVTNSFGVINVSLFSMATSVSIVAFLFPGGIGVREGILVYFLVKSGISADIAAMISILSRFWFLIGECFYFLLAFTIEKVRKSKIQ